jgi:hypothetical protein
MTMNNLQGKQGNWRGLYTVSSTAWNGIGAVSA